MGPGSAVAAFRTVELKLLWGFVKIPSETDVVIAGGGVAGSAAAAALGEFGFQVVVVEPGLDATRRLAGELIHPPGAAALAELGLLPALRQSVGAPVNGFAIYLGAKSPACVLPYDEIPGVTRQGLAIEHTYLRERLLEAVARLPHVSVCRGGRIVELDLSQSDSAIATVARGKERYPIRARFVVAADGGASKVSTLAGIGRRRTRISNMLGFLLKDCQLPFPAAGNVFLGGIAPVLAYEIGGGMVRVMIDIPDLKDGDDHACRYDSYVRGIPEPLRGGVLNALLTGKTLQCANYSFTPERMVKKRLVLVGDAGGCCHPLTATGLSISAQDAIRLRNALRDCASDIPAALVLYAACRKRPQHTRMVLAHALYETFKAQTPEMRLMRQGLLRYWTTNPEGRAASMALLSTRETRITAMATQYLSVVLCALGALVAGGDADGRKSLAARGRVVLGVSRATLAYASQAFKEW